MPVLTGRERVYTRFSEINRDNVLQALSEANSIHMRNRKCIRFLFRYYRGDQPVYKRTKTVRDDIKHNTVVNHASEIVRFLVSYLLADPAVYVLRKAADETQAEDLRRLNDYMEMADKDSCDKEIADDFTICGTGYRFVYPNPDYNRGDNDKAPFTIDTYDPERTYIAYEESPSRDPRPVFCVTTSRTPDSRMPVYDVYTDDTHFIIIGDPGSLNGVTIEEETNLLGEIPMVEYVNNQFRIGGFECVIDLLNDTNVLESNRVEATEQNVQALTWMNDVDLTEEEEQRIKEEPSAFIYTRTIKGATSPSIKPIVTDLQQQDQQVLQNDLYKKILTIVGMPSTSDGNSNDSSNNGSTLVRNGWYQAEARAKDTAKLWQRSDKKFLRLVFKCINALAEPFQLTEKDVTCKFTRRNYEDVMTKASVLSMLLGNDKVAPIFAYTVSGLAPDPEEACKMGLDWMEKLKDEENRSAEASGTAGGNQQGTGGGQRRGNQTGAGQFGSGSSGPNGEIEIGNQA